MVGLTKWPATPGRQTGAREVDLEQLEALRATLVSIAVEILSTLVVQPEEVDIDERALYAHAYQRTWSISGPRIRASRDIRRMRTAIRIRRQLRMAIPVIRVAWGAPPAGY